MSFWYRLKVRLGLADDWDDEEYYDDEYGEETAELESERHAPGRSYDRSSTYSSGSAPGAVRRLDRGADLERARASSAGLRSVPAHSESSAQVRMHIVQPKAFAEAQAIADKFKDGTPVIMNLTMTGSDVSKRLIDFASGLTYGLDGGLQKVSDKVFMLTPANVEVSDVDRRRLKDTGFFPAE